MKRNLTLRTLKSKYNKGHHLTDGEIIYCLLDIDRYLLDSKLSGLEPVSRIDSMILFRAELIAEQRSRTIDKIL